MFLGGNPQTQQKTGYPTENIGHDRGVASWIPVLVTSRDLFAGSILQIEPKRFGFSGRIK